MPPFLIFFLAGIVAAMSPHLIRATLTVMVPAISGALLLFTDLGNYFPYQIFDYRGEIYRFDELSRLFGYLFHIAALIGGIYALHIRDRIQQVSVFFYAGSALGAVMAGDLITLFIFWEI